MIRHLTKVFRKSSISKKTFFQFFPGERASWERVLHTFQKYAIDFKKKYGVVPILIFDNCDLLGQKQPEMLEILQDTAKNAIDDCLWVTVFVTSVGVAPEQMEGMRGK